MLCFNLFGGLSENVKWRQGKGPLQNCYLLRQMQPYCHIIKNRFFLTQICGGLDVTVLFPIYVPYRPCAGPV